ncbi:diaminopimelate decarboxylase family protein [Candidatus Bipolaricaulota bacterium]
MTKTTDSLDALLKQHADVIGRQIDRYELPLHVVFLKQFEVNAMGFKSVLQAEYSHAFAAFAVKSNPCRGAVRAASDNGLGADVASENELRLALEEKIPSNKIVCNGNAKSTVYLRMALEAGCLIAVDNHDEIAELERLAAEGTCKVNVLLRFRGMPLAGFTTADQTTAADWTKFGFHIEQAPHLFSRLSNHATFRFRGVSAHIGTQIAEPLAYERLLDHLLRLTEEAQTFGLSPDVIDIGGGFPAAFLSEEEWRSFQGRLLDRLRGDSTESVTWNDLSMGYASDVSANAPWVGKAYWSAVPQSQMLSHLLRHSFTDGRSCIDRLAALGSPTLIVEPGRALMASAGITLTQVAGTKAVLDHVVVSLEMGINNHGTNLISPDMFSAAVLPSRSDDEPIDAFLAGRLCFSGDMISKTKTRLNRLPERGDRFVIFHTGAYSADHFASNSCGFLRPAKVAIRPDGRAEVWRKPEIFAEIFGVPGKSLLIDESAPS